MSTSHKDRIGEYLYQTMKGDAPEKPSQITDELHWGFRGRIEMLPVVLPQFYRTTCISSACKTLSCSLSEEKVLDISLELFEKIEAASSYRPLLDYLGEF